MTTRYTYLSLYNRGVRNDFLVPIPFSLLSNYSHSHPFPFQHCIHIPIYPITSIFIPTHSHSHLSYHLYSHSHLFPFPFPAATIYLKAEKWVHCVVNSKQNMKLQQKHCWSNSSLVSHYHQAITITALYISLFTVQRLSDCHCMLLCKNSRLFTLPVGILFTYKICYSHCH